MNQDQILRQAARNSSDEDAMVKGKRISLEELEKEQEEAAVDAPDPSSLVSVYLADILQRNSVWTRAEPSYVPDVISFENPVVEVKAVLPDGDTRIGMKKNGVWVGHYVDLYPSGNIHIRSCFDTEGRHDGVHCIYEDGNVQKFTEYYFDHGKLKRDAFQRQRIQEDAKTR